MIIEHALASFITSPKKIALAVAAVGLVWGGAQVKGWLDDVALKDEKIAAKQKSIDELTGKLTKAQHDNADLRGAYVARESDLLRQIDVAEADAQAAGRRAEKLAALIKEIRNAKSGPDDGPLAPVLRVALVRVRDDLRGTIPTG